MSYRSVYVAAFFAALTTVASAAKATTVDFAYTDLGATVASGSFSYATGTTGVLGYGDLSSFDVTLFGDTYDLSDAESLPNYNYFAYDTSAGKFVDNENSCGTTGCYTESLGATSDALDDGYFFNASDGADEFEDYKTGTIGSFDTISYVTSAAPEPSTWMLMLGGIGSIGLALRQAKRKTLVSSKEVFAA